MTDCHDLNTAVTYIYPCQNHSQNDSIWKENSVIKSRTVIFPNKIFEK